MASLLVLLTGGTLYLFFNWLLKARDFPRLSDRNSEITSDPTPRYNCIAWAAGDMEHWWDPWNYWPEGVNRGTGIGDLIAAYRTRGFEPCENGAYQEGVQKIALYGKNGQWTHAAKQLNRNSWSSKLGKNDDIRHDEPDDVGGGLCGNVVAYMAK